MYLIECDRCPVNLAINGDFLSFNFAISIRVHQAINCSQWCKAFTIRRWLRCVCSSVRCAPVALCIARFNWETRKRDFKQFPSSSFLHRVRSHDFNPYCNSSSFSDFLLCGVMVFCIDKRKDRNFRKLYAIFHWSAGGILTLAKTHLIKKQPWLGSPKTTTLPFPRRRLDCSSVYWWVGKKSRCSGKSCSEKESNFYSHFFKSFLIWTYFLYCSSKFWTKKNHLYCLFFWFFFLQKMYEQKQYKTALKIAKQILANPKLADHGGRIGCFFAPLFISNHFLGLF